MNRLTLWCIFVWLIIIKCSISFPYSIFFVHFPYTYIYKNIHTLSIDANIYLHAGYIQPAMYTGQQPATTLILKSV